MIFDGISNDTQIIRNLKYIQSTILIFKNISIKYFPFARFFRNLFNQLSKLST
jgi:hypothetical protein